MTKSFDNMDLSVTREETAQAEVGHTDIDRRVSIALVLVFLFGIGFVPVVQTLREISAGKSPHVASILGVPGKVLKRAKGRSLFDRTLNANAMLLASIKDYNNVLEEQSFLRQIALVPSQRVLTGVLGAGNEKAYVGRDGWLFYRPGVEYVTGPGFLDAGVLRKRAAEGVQPDPRKAIIQFSEELKRRGIQLVIMPTPVKPMHCPEKLSSRFSPDSKVLQNPSYDEFVEELRQAGVHVFEPSKMLFLKTDSHWTPEGMATSAKELADFLVKLGIKKLERNEYHSEVVLCKNLGDIAGMLGLGDDQKVFKPEAITVDQVLTRQGALWCSQRESEILFLGDSFSNIYSLDSMGWSSSAGFVEHLSLLLQRPIDTIRQNDSGAFATRQRLRRNLARGDDRLADKRVVIWQFAIRELAVGNWKLMEMMLGKARTSEFLEVKPGTHMVVTGEIVSRAPSPRPDKVTYRDHVFAMHLTGIRSADGKVKDAQAVVRVLGMANHRLTPMALLRPGQKVTLKLMSWDDVVRKVGRLNRNDLDDEELMLDTPVWGELLPTEEQ